MERVNDLLNVENENLEIKEHREDGVFVVGLSREVRC
jgi:hypothetical protein